MRRVPVLVCGEPERGDDAAAYAAVALLPGLASFSSSGPAADVVPVGQLDASALLDLPAGTPCVVVDAVAGPRPGTVLTLPLAQVARALPDGVRHRSSHALPLAEVLTLAASLRPDGLPGWFVGIAGEMWGLGEGLSGSVAAALPAFAEAIAAAIVAAASEVETAAG